MTSLPIYPRGLRLRTAHRSIHPNQPVKESNRLYRCLPEHLKPIGEKLEVLGKEAIGRETHALRQELHEGKQELEEKKRKAERELGMLKDDFGMLGMRFSGGE